MEGKKKKEMGEEVERIGKRYERGGIKKIVRKIDYRQRKKGEYIYIVEENKGSIIEGNVERVEKGVIKKEGIIESEFKYRS